MALKKGLVFATIILLFFSLPVYSKENTQVQPCENCSTVLQCLACINQKIISEIFKEPIQSKNESTSAESNPSNYPGLSEREEFKERQKTGFGILFCSRTDYKDQEKGIPFSKSNKQCWFNPEMKDSYYGGYLDQEYLFEIVKGSQEKTAPKFVFEILHWGLDEEEKNAKTIKTQEGETMIFSFNEQGKYKVKLKEKPTNKELDYRLFSFLNVEKAYSVFPITRKIATSKGTTLPFSFETKYSNWRGNWLIYEKKDIIASNENIETYKKEFSAISSDKIEYCFPKEGTFSANLTLEPVNYGSREPVTEQWEIIVKKNSKTCK